MFDWNKKEAPLKALAGMGGGVGRGGGGDVDVELHIYGGKSSNGGRGGASPYGGYTYISGTASPGTTLAYVVGLNNGNQQFYSGGPGPGNNGHGGGFSAVWVSGNTLGSYSRDANYLLGVAGGSGAGGNDGYNDCRGGYGGGVTGGNCPESPDNNLGGNGGGQGSGGSSPGHGSNGATNGTQWTGGSGANEQCGGGGGGWHGGGGGATNGSYDAGGGGGAGYIGSTPRTLENPHGTFKVTGGQTYNGGYPGPGAPIPVGAAYPHTGQSHPAGRGRVYIIIDGVEVHDGTSNPSSAASTYTIP